MGLCFPCFTRGRMEPAAKVVAGTKMCDSCFRGYDGPRERCQNPDCGRELRSNNISGFCIACTDAGVTRRAKIKARRADPAVRTDPCPTTV